MPHQAYLHPFVTRTFFLGQSFIFKYLYPSGWAIYSLFNRIQGGNSSDISPYSLLFTGLAGLLGLWVLNAVRRRLFSLFYSMMAFSFWIVLILAGFVAYLRGFEQTIEDVSNLANLFLNAQEKGQRRGAGKARQKEWEAKRLRKW